MTLQLIDFQNNQPPYRDVKRGACVKSFQYKKLEKFKVHHD